MTWTKLSDDYADRLEDLELSPTACWLHTAALVYCNRVGKNGRLPVSKLNKVSSVDDPALYVAELEQAGLWALLDGGAAWQIDWEDQELAEDVRKRRELAVVRQRRRRQHLAGDHALCDSRYCKAVTRESRVTSPESPPVTRDSRRESRPPVPPVPPGPKEPGRVREPDCSVCSAPEHICRERNSHVARDERHEYVPKTKPDAMPTPARAAAQEERTA